MIGVGRSHLITLRRYCNLPRSSGSTPLIRQVNTATLEKSPLVGHFLWSTTSTTIAPPTTTVRRMSTSTATDPAANLPPRAESDSFGSLDIAAGKLWGAQTQRSIGNFPIGGLESRMPLPIVYGMATVKKCCAQYNKSIGKMPADVADSIAQAADEGRCFFVFVTVVVEVMILSRFSSLFLCLCLCSSSTFITYNILHM